MSFPSQRTQRAIARLSILAAALFIVDPRQAAADPVQWRRFAQTYLEKDEAAYQKAIQ